MISGPNTKEACRQLWAIGLKPRFAKPAKIADMKGDLCAAAAEAIVYGYGKTGSAIWSSIGAWDLRTDLANFSAPTLLIHGEAEAIPMDMVEEWTTVLPNARLLRILGYSQEETIKGLSAETTRRRAYLVALAYRQPLPEFGLSRLVEAADDGAE